MAINLDGGVPKVISGALFGGALCALSLATATQTPSSPQAPTIIAITGLIAAVASLVAALASLLRARDRDDDEEPPHHHRRR